MNDAPAAPISIRQVFADTRYRVPMYQRAYAWGANEIEALFRDVHDVRGYPGVGRYYIGTLVVHRSLSGEDGHPIFDVVDGQQRLTTLFLTFANPVVRKVFGSHVVLPALTSAMLGYEGRPRSSRDLGALVRMEGEADLAAIDDDGLRAASELIVALVHRHDITVEDLRYLLDEVEIVRTLLPANTDLNHYFEIMNSRGEQLEKHEIVKAHLMGCLDEAADRRGFAAVWDACSNLAKHVQAATPKRCRTDLFGAAWNDLAPLAFDALGEKLAGSSATISERGIIGLLEAGIAAADAPLDIDDDETPRYGTIIDFPNFLLHVLRLHVTAERPGTEPTTIALDDKRLVEQFKAEFRPGSSSAVKQFAEHLFRARFLFDNFVLRTDNVRDATDDDSNWVIHRPHRTGTGAKERVTPEAAFGGPEQVRITMLQAMFQVTDSRRPYKDFLYRILCELDALWTDTRAIDPQALIARLEAMAAARARDDAALGLDSGTAVRHFVFNYLDYLLWRAYVVAGEAVPSGVEAAEFRFRYRTSVEHFYPVAPERDPLPLETVNQFGNLCIMGRQENSRRSNLVPNAKIVQYLSSDQCLKFQVMASIARANGAWDETQMRAHGADCERLLETGTTSVWPF